MDRRSEPPGSLRPIWTSQAAAGHRSHTGGPRGRGRKRSPYPVLAFIALTWEKHPRPPHLNQRSDLESNSPRFTVTWAVETTLCVLTKLRRSALWARKRVSVRFAQPSPRCCLQSPPGNARALRAAFRVLLCRPGLNTRRFHPSTAAQPQEGRKVEKERKGRPYFS